MTERIRRSKRHLQGQIPQAQGLPLSDWDETTPPEAQAEAPSGLIPAPDYDPIEAFHEDRSLPPPSQAKAPSQIPPQRATRPSKPLKKAPKRATALTLVLSWAFILFCAYLVMYFVQLDRSFSARQAFMRRDVFYEGISVDQIPIGGLRFSEAEAFLSRTSALPPPTLNIQLQVDDKSYRITNLEIPITQNTSRVLESAYALGRRELNFTPGSGRTPFEARYEDTRRLLEEGAAFKSQLGYRAEDVQALSRSIADQVNREPVNAVLQSFDFTSRTFSVTNDVHGAKIDPDSIASALRQALDAHSWQAEISLKSTPIMPKVTAVELKNSFTRIASCSTQIGRDTAWDQNIKLALEAISGRTLMPKGEFSFNAVTGERTEEKGYRTVFPREDSLLREDPGGGINQVAGTLLQAAALADMKLVTRQAPAWPSLYIGKGLDAAVDQAGMDLVFVNERDTPVFIVANYQKHLITVDIYGMSRGPGEEIRLETKVLSSDTAPREVILQQNPALESGTKRELSQARPGYRLETWRVYLNHKTEYRRELLFISDYKAMGQVLEYHD